MVKTVEDITPAKRRKSEIHEIENIPQAYTYFNGKPAPDDLEMDELSEEEIVRWYAFFGEVRKLNSCEGSSVSSARKVRRFGPYLLRN